jgi:formate hydrogenlyase subunit 6/NADH:ubiquinone oxidoreductase subunit I
MKIGTMLTDVFNAFLSKPITQEYPSQRTPAPEKLRGRLLWEHNRCSGCGLCVKDCPANALEVITIDRANKRFVMVYHLDKCTYCAQCVVNCRFKCLEMSATDWELAGLKKKDFTKYYGDEGDVDVYLAQLGHSNAEPPGID